MRTELLGLLRALVDGDVAFIVVGGVAAILEGAPLSTFDVDVVYGLEDGNVEKLLAVLDGLNAVYRDPAGRKILPTAERLGTQRVNLLRTRLGDLDVLQEIGHGWRYADLQGRSHQELVGDLRLAVLDLSAIIESKEVAGRPKDQLMLPTLRRTLELRQRRGE